MFVSWLAKCKWKNTGLDYTGLVQDNNDEDDDEEESNSDADFVVNTKDNDEKKHNVNEIFHFIIVKWIMIIR